MSFIAPFESKLLAPILRTGTCLLLVGAVGCQQPPPPDEMRPVASVREVMADMVGPSADVLWSAITSVDTPDGYVDKGPETDEEWARLRHSATTMVESANLLLMDGRSIAPEGATSTAPGYNLEPDSIATLVAMQHEDWVRVAHGLQDVGQSFLDAVDARNADPLFDLGGDLTTACEDCHQVFWYPTN